MNTRQIVYVLKVANEGSISKAAEKLNITQPTLSKTIGLLEESLGVDLFDRNSMPLKLTYAGEIFVDACEKINFIEEDVQKKIQEIKQESNGQISVSIAGFRACSFLPEVVRLFRKQYSKVSLSVFEGTTYEVIENVKRHDVNIAIVTDDFDRNIFESKCLYTEEILVAISKKLLLSLGVFDLFYYKEEIDITDLTIIPFVTNHKNQLMRCVFDNTFIKGLKAPEVVVECTNTETCISFVNNGIVGMLVQSTAINNQLFDDDVVFRKISGVSLTRNIYAIWLRSTYLNTIENYFIECVGECLKK